MKMQECGKNVDQSFPHAETSMKRTSWYENEKRSQTNKKHDHTSGIEKAIVWYRWSNKQVIQEPRNRATI